MRRYFLIVVMILPFCFGLMFFSDLNVTTLKHILLHEHDKPEKSLAKALKAISQFKEDGKQVEWLVDDKTQRIFTITRHHKKDNNGNIIIQLSLSSREWGQLGSIQQLSDSEVLTKTSLENLSNSLLFLKQQKALPELVKLEGVLRSDYEKAWYYYDQNTEQSLKRAVASFDNVLAQHPSHVESLLGKSSAYNELSFYSQSLENAEIMQDMAFAVKERAMRLAPEHPRVRASRFQFSGDWRNDEKNLLSLLKEDVSCRVCVNKLVDLYWIVGWYEKSENVLQDQLVYFPMSVRLHAHLAAANARSGHVKSLEQQIHNIAFYGGELSGDVVNAKIDAAFLKGNASEWVNLYQSYVSSNETLNTLLSPYFSAIATKDDQRIKEAITAFPENAFFDLRLVAGQINEPINLIESNLANNDYFGFALIHGFYAPKNHLTEKYVMNLNKIKDEPRIISLFKKHKLLDFWIEVEQYPDYCYKAGKPKYCHSFSLSKT